MAISEGASGRSTTFCYGASGTIETVMFADGTILTGKQVLDAYPWLGSDVAARPRKPIRFDVDASKPTEEPQDPL